MEEPSSENRKNESQRKSEHSGKCEPEKCKVPQKSEKSKESKMSCPTCVSEKSCDCPSEKSTKVRSSQVSSDAQGVKSNKSRC
ncbi:unnamed protein product [Calicophoron daubneyi]|uniref:Uncharacterized protein n=1 Tax=Calicophoron daubneyi TaxID=300641 RepID=A0AAV2U268_CALDB